MKNFKLLLATTAILSTGALMANADPNDPRTVYASISGGNLNLKAEAVLINSLQVEEKQSLSFGGIVQPKGGQKVVIGPRVSDSSLTTATLVSAGISAGYGDAQQDLISLGSHIGIIEISGSYFADEVDGEVAGGHTEQINPNGMIFFDNNVDSHNVPLTATSGETTIPCGVVDFLSEESGGVHMETVTSLDKITFEYGGTLTLDTDIETNMAGKKSLKCEASVPVTFIYGYNN